MVVCSGATIKRMPRKLLDVEHARISPMKHEICVSRDEAGGALTPAVGMESATCYAQKATFMSQSHTCSLFLFCRPTARIEAVTAIKV
jgi:hypothetical protein